MPETDTDGVADAYVIGVGIHRSQVRNTKDRLEEMVWRTSRAALEHAGVGRAELDSVVLGASDELDGRTISSMLLAAPAGGYLKDEIKVSDSGAMAFCLGTARIMSEAFHLGIVASWCKCSKTDVEAALWFGADPFFTRPLGLSRTVADGLLAQAVAERWGVGEDEVAGRVVAAYERAAHNPRGLHTSVPRREAVATSPYVATPLRDLHRAPLSDGAVALVMASGHWLRSHPGIRPLARVAGVGWAAGSYRLGKERLQGMPAADRAWQLARRQAGIRTDDGVDLAELDAPTGFHEAALVRLLGLRSSISPSGGPFAQNPYFCTGLLNVAEAVLQVAGEAGAVQVEGAHRAAAHGMHGFAGQGHVFAIVESVNDQS